MLQSIFLLLLFYALGEVISEFFLLPIPGSVIGMILLVIALQTKIFPKEKISPSANFLTKNIAFLFIPAGVGVMQYFDILKENFFSVLAASVISTLFVMAAVGMIQQWAER